MITIKRANEFDAEVLAQLGQSTFEATFAKDNSAEDIHKYVAETFGTEKQRLEIIDPNRFIELAFVGTSPAGYVHLLDGASDPCVLQPKPIEILRLYVASGWHGKGVAQALMHRSLQIAKELKFQTIWLGVWEHNHRAQAFYRKFGFEKIGVHTFQLGSDNQIDLIMSRTV